MVTRDQFDKICGYRRSIRLANPPGVTQAEFSWAETLASTAQSGDRGAGPALGWTPVTGIAEAPRLRDCARDSWLMSIRNPSARRRARWAPRIRRGRHQFGYAAPIVAALQQKFYPDGVARLTGDSKRSEGRRKKEEGRRKSVSFFLLLFSFFLSSHLLPQRLYAARLATISLAVRQHNHQPPLVVVRTQQSHRVQIHDARFDAPARTGPHPIARPAP